MEEKLQAEEWVEERKRRRKAERKHILKIHEGEEPAEIRRKEKYPPEIKRFDEVEKTEKLDPIIFHLSRSTELNVPSLNEYSRIEKTEKIDLITFYLNRSSKLKIPPLREYPRIEHGSKLKPVLIKGEEYSPSLRIAELIEDITINYPSVIAPIKILKPDATKIVIPKVRFEEILLPNCILLQGGERPLEKDKAREELETRELLIAGGYESAGGEVETEEKSDFLDLLFSEGSSGKLESGEPIVICLEEPEENSFIGALRTICLRIYREKKGGKPKPIIFSDAEELKKEIRWMEAEDKIFSAQLSKEEWDKLQGEDEKRIFNRIKQLFSQYFGFIIFNTAKFLHSLEQHQVNITMLKPKELDIELTRRISEITWGFVETEDGGSFDYIFDSARKKFEKSLKNIQHEKRGIYVDISKPHEGKESEEHKWMKWFIVRYLVEKYLDRLPKEDREAFKPLDIKRRVETLIESETPIDQNGPIPDIFEKLGSEVYEVETLFAEDGEGKTPREKINQTIDKYRGEKLNRINIIFDNLTLLRHLKEISDIEYIRTDMKNDNSEPLVKFWTLNVKTGKLIHWREVVKELDNLNKDLKSEGHLKGGTLILST